MKMTRTVLLMTAFLASSVVLAQETSGGRAAGPDGSDSGQTAIRDTSSNETATEKDDVTSQPDYVLKPWRALRGHLHNKIIHVPIGFALSAFLLSLLSLRWTEMQPAIRWLVCAAALGALFAYVTGTNQAAAFESGSKEWVIEIHESLGISTAVTLWVWAVSFWLRPAKKWSFLIGVLALVLVVVTGFFGGVIAHG